MHSQPQFICHIVFARMESYLCVWWARRLRDSTPATPPTPRETWLAWPESRSKVSCCRRLSICPLAPSVWAVPLSAWLVARRCLCSTSPFHPSYIIRRSDKWKTIIECQFVTVITARDARMRQFPRLLLGDPFFLSCSKCAKQCFLSDIDHFVSWHNEAACEKFNVFFLHIFRTNACKVSTYIQQQWITPTQLLHNTECNFNYSFFYCSCRCSLERRWTPAAARAELGKCFCFGAMPPPGLASLWHHTTAAAAFCFNYQEETWVMWPEPWRRLPAVLPHRWIMVDEWLIWIKCV